MFDQLLNKYTANPRSLFLLDGFGAVLSATLYALVLANLVDVFGVPQKILYVLAGLAVIYAIYSFSCYSLNLKKWRPYLKIIALANLFHSGITIGLMMKIFEKFTVLGIVYFIGELIVVTFLAYLELRVATGKVSD